MVKYIFTFLLFVHGAIHFMGVAKAFDDAPVNALTQAISKPAGAIWGLSALLFLLSALLFFLRKDSWVFWAILGVVLSQVSIFANWQDAKYGTIVNLIVVTGAIIGFGTTHFVSKFENEVKTGLQRTSSIPTAMLLEADMEHLPVPVKKYLRYVGAVGKPKVVNFKIEFVGKIRKNEQSEWMPLVSEQYNFMDVPTRLFFLKARMKNLPIAGFHSFKNGEAFMDIRLLSLFKVQFLSGKEMGIAETVTFFNDMCCLAPATLIDPKIEWLETHGNKVKASFSNNGITITAWLFFNDEGQLVNFRSNDRWAAGEGKAMRQIPWATPLKNYREIDGHMIAGDADVIYSYPEGDLIYGSFSIRHVEYNCQQF